MATTVSRRLVYVKKTKNPHAPLPRRQSPSREMVGEKAKPTAPLAARVQVQPAPTRGRGKFAMWAALAGGMGCIAVAIAAAGQIGFSSNKGRAATEQRPAVVRNLSPVRVQTPVSSAELLGESLPSLMAQRAAPTDDSFRASSYIRGR